MDTCTCEINSLEAGQVLKQKYRLKYMYLKYHYAEVFFTIVVATSRHRTNYEIYIFVLDITIL